MANEIKLKKWDADNDEWVQQYPEVRHTDIIASGTNNSVNYLAGDGSWKAPLYYVVGNTTGTAGTWTGTISGLTAYYDGLTIRYKQGIAGATNVYLNINNLGNAQVYRMAGNRLTTHWPTGTISTLTYNSSDNRWYANGDYNSTDDYRMRWQGDVAVGTLMHGYQIIMEGADRKFHPVTEGGSTANTNTVSTVDFLVGGTILYHYSGNNQDVDSTGIGYEVYESGQFSSMEYFNNRDSGWATARYPFYFKGTINSSGHFNLDNTSYTSWLTQTLPTSDDGFVYIQIGYMADDYDDFRLASEHPIYIYKDGALRLYPYFSEFNGGTITNNLTVSSGTSGDAFLKIEADTDNNNENDNPYLQFNQDGGNTIVNAGITGDAGTIFTNSLANAGYFGHEENASVQFYTSGLARLTIREDGDVGINTTSPATGYKLDVNGKIRSNNEIVATKFVDYNNGNYYIDPANDSIVNYIQAGLSSGSYKTQLQANALQFDRDGTSYIQQAGTGNIAFRFGSSLTTRMTLTNSGGVGIGTTSPQGKLTVEQNMTAGGSAFSAPHLALNASNTVDSTGFVGMTMATSTADNYGWSYGAQRTSSGIGDLYWRNHSGTSAGNDRMILTSDGNLGIGTSSPTPHSANRKALIISDTTNDALIELHGSSSGKALFQSVGGHTYLSNYGSSGNLNFGSGSTGSTKMMITSGGNVGIGTDSPVATLDVQTADGSAIDMIISHDDIGMNEYIGLGFRGYTAGSGSIKSAIVKERTGSYGTGKLHFLNETTVDDSNADLTDAVMTIAGSSVGIGTTSPSHTLHISGDTRIEGDLTVNGNYTQVNTVESTTEQWSVTNDGTGPAVTINQTGSQPVIDIQDDGTSVFHIEDGGNVGIKTTNPTTTFEVVGRTLSTTFSARTNSSRDKYRLYDSSSQYTIGMQSGVSYGGLNDWAMTFQFNNENDRGFWWGDTSHSTAQGAMALTTNGLLTVANRIRVGYGESDTTTPSSTQGALDVYGNVNISGVIPTLKLQSSNNNDEGEIHFTNQATQNARIRHEVADSQLKEGGQALIFEDLSGTTFHTEVNGNTYAKRFYDYDDTAYYVDPASTSVMNFLNVQKLEVEGAIFNVETDSLVMPMVKGGHYEEDGTVTGAIEIILPSGTYANATMLNFFVDVYDYNGGSDGESFTLHIGGYIYTNGTWYNTFANLVSGRTDRFFNVRFNNDSSNNYNIIYIGETTSNWDYPKVTVRDFSAGFSGADDADWYNNSFSLDITSTMLGTTNNNKSAENVASNSLQLGGVNASNYLRSDTADTASGNITFTGDIIADADILVNSPVNDSAPISVKSLSNNRAIHIEETGTGSESWQLGVDTDGNLNFFNSGSSSYAVRFNDNNTATFSSTVTASNGKLASVEYNGSDVDKVNFALSGSTLTITTT